MRCDKCSATNLEWIEDELHPEGGWWFCELCHEREEAEFAENDDDDWEGGRMSELLNCPFCGGTAEVREYRGQKTSVFFVACSVCSVTSPPADYDASSENAIAAWNRRTLVAEPQPVAPVPLDAPDEVDCDYWFDGVATSRG